MQTITSYELCISFLLQLDIDEYLHHFSIGEKWLFVDQVGVFGHPGGI